MQACAHTRLLVREAKTLLKREDLYPTLAAPAGASPHTEQPQPDLVIVDKSVVRRVSATKGELDSAGSSTSCPSARAGQSTTKELYWDEVLVVEFRATPTLEGLEYATASALLKTSVIKASTLSNGDM